MCYERATWRRKACARCKRVLTAAGFADRRGCCRRSDASGKRTSRRLTGGFNGRAKIARLTSLKARPSEAREEAMPMLGLMQRLAVDGRQSARPRQGELPAAARWSPAASKARLSRTTYGRHLASGEAGHQCACRSAASSSATASARLPGTPSGISKTWYGAMGMGAVLHTMNPRLFPEQIAWIINHAEDKILFL